MFIRPPTNQRKKGSLDPSNTFSQGLSHWMSSAASPQKPAGPAHLSPVCCYETAVCCECQMVSGDSLPGSPSSPESSEPPGQVSEAERSSPAKDGTTLPLTLTYLPRYLSSIAPLSLTRERSCPSV